MKIIVCVGDNNAMLFHNRRISRDRAVIEDILPTRVQRSEERWTSKNLDE